MSTSTITSVHKLNIVDYFARGTVIPRINKICWGRGGHLGNSARTVNANANSLFTKIGETTDVTIKPEQDAILFTSKITAEQAGEVISEVGLINTSNQLVCHKTFPPKFTASGETYTISIRIVV